MRFTNHKSALTAVSIAVGAITGFGLVQVQGNSPEGQDALPVVELPGTGLLELQLRNKALMLQVTELTATVVKLEAQLSWSEDYRFQQEQEFLVWQQVLSGLDPQGTLLGAGLLEGMAGSDDEASAVVVPPDASIVRAEELGLSLRNLMLSEGLFDLDLLEVGRLERGAIGPVVFRMLDDRGRLVGSLTGKTLHFEASVTARTVTMILVDGAESHGGLSTPFTNRRFPFSFVDPWPWVEGLPELFPDFDAGQATPSGVDDGLWDLSLLRSQLNGLLGRDGNNGYFKIKHIDGVRSSELRGLHLVEYSADGLAMRNLFTDRATISLEDRGVSLLLKDGASMRGDEKTPFLRGQHRIFLPKAVHAAWTAANLPGLPKASPSD